MRPELPRFLRVEPGHFQRMLATRQRATNNERWELWLGRSYEVIVNNTDRATHDCRVVRIARSYARFRNAHPEIGRRTAAGYRQIRFISLQSKLGFNRSYC